MEKENKYQSILNHYSYPIFKMGFAHMIDIGVRHSKDITDEDVEEFIEDERSRRDPDGLYLITPEALGDVIRVAREIAIRFEYEDLETLFNM